MKSTLAWMEYCKSLAPAIVEACARTAVSAGPSALVKALGNAIPEWRFRHVLVRGGWYRLGGIVNAQGERVADSVEQWVEHELALRDGDITHLSEDFAGETLYATRLVGQTHYLLASAGDAADDFLQLEIEDLQEMRVHRLFANEPGSIEELVDPRIGQDMLKPIGLPSYAWRRLQHMGAFLERMRVQKPEGASIHRMLADWSASSAGSATDFANHWVIATREHLDRYQQPVFRAQPIATMAGEPPEFSAENGTSGLKLHDALLQFDRKLGYPMAWYFHLLTSHAVPHWVAQSTVEDALAGFAYLPQKDVDIVRRWLHQPYSL